MLLVFVILSLSKDLCRCHAWNYGFTGKGSKNRQETYLAAVTRGYGQDFTPLTNFFVDAIRRRLEETTP